MMKYQ